ncbi:insulinase family protein [Brevundimonas vitis]|uniref:Insulinase family protein n=1 Tax=Brevundimonas vitisensis TaxID=2800818 RepID=A0ABX7BLY0_9CAUL|nr:M16 family metallopeptidase [Brevundimonas vitisensis]QQQ18261.1 insulinase family protein [Brevundimonas vitisensis]
MRSARHLLLVAASGATLMFAAALPGLAMAQDAPATSTQVAAVAPSDPWPQATSDVPADPAVRFGQLPNGLRYAIMHNATPPGQASLRVRIDAGSLMEREDQRGLAHFMEHMAFNGSTNVPEGELTRTLERLGLAFGADTNAYTSFGETVYQLDLPRTDDETIDTSLMILRDMMGEATLAADAIDRERGIVLSEERTRAGPGLRSLMARLDFLMPGQLVPDRLPIGDTSVLANAPRERFVEFYSAYYRPSRATVVAVGDFDVDAMEAKIVAEFGDWIPDAPDGAEPDLGTPQARSLEAGVYSEPGSPASVQIAWISPPDLRPDTLAKQREEAVRYLGIAILNRRLSTLARGENPPFVGASASRSTEFRSQDTASIFASFQSGGWQPALNAIDQEQRRIVQFGVSQAELDREITEWRTGLANGVAGAATRRTPALAGALVSAVDGDSVFTSPQTDLQIFESIVGGLTLDEVNAALKTTFTGSGPVVFVTTPDPIDGGEATVLAALAASQAVAVTAPVAESAQTWPYTDFGTPSGVAETSRVEDLDVTFVTFNNGVRLTIKPTTFRDDQVLVTVSTAGGYLSLPTDRLTPVWAAGSAVSEGGVSRLTADQLEQALTGRTYGISFQVTEDTFAFNGATKPEDFGLQMQVLTAYLTDPAWRPEPFERIRGQFRQALPQLDAVPGGVFARESGGLLRSGDPRWTFPTLAQLGEASLDDLRQAITAGVATGPIEVVVVGDVDVNQVIEQVGSTLGALPARAASAPVAADARTVRFPAGTPQPVQLTHAGRPDQALGFIAWPTVDNFSDPKEARLVRLLGDILRLRLIDELREGQAVTYSPSVSASASGVFTGYGYLSAAIEAPPEKMAGFFADADRIAAALATGPITADELDRARNPRVESLRRSQATNEFWLSELQDAQTDPARLPTLRTVISDVETATVEDVQAVAARYLSPDRAYRVQVVPTATAAAAPAE